MTCLPQVRLLSRIPYVGRACPVHYPVKARGWSLPPSPILHPRLLTSLSLSLSHFGSSGRVTAPIRSSKLHRRRGSVDMPTIWSGHVCLQAWSCAGHWRTRCSAVSSAPLQWGQVAESRRPIRYKYAASNEEWPLQHWNKAAKDWMTGRAGLPSVKVEDGRCQWSPVACPTLGTDASTTRRWPHRKPTQGPHTGTLHQSSHGTLRLIQTMHQRYD